MMIWIVYKNEMIKAVKRLATWVTGLFFTFILFMEHGVGGYLEARRNDDGYFGLPDQWPNILTDDVEVTGIIASVLLILLVASEFQWRTSRQNVIDGLSKDQWFVGKLLLVPTAALLFYGGRIVVGGFFAFLGTDPTVSSEPMISGIHIVAGMGATIGVLITISLAFFLAMSVRNSGPAMGLLLVALFIEQIFRAIFTRFEWEMAADVMPFSVAGRFFRWIQYDPVAFDAAVQRAVDADRSAPEVWDPALLYSAGLGWIAVFLVGSYLWYRKTDL